MLFFSINFLSCEQQNHGETYLHELAQDCFWVRPKCRIDMMLDREAIDPFIKDKRGYTAREICDSRY